MFFPTFERIKALAVKHHGKTFTPERLTHLIRMQFRDKQLRFVCQRTDEVTAGNFIIKGEYYPYEDSQDETCLYIGLAFSKQCRKVSFKKYNWESISFHLADTITHEYLHRYYIRKRGFLHGKAYRSSTQHTNRDSMKDYLGCEDEILAYSFNVASEMVVYNRTMEQTKIYRLYRKHFKQDPKVLTQLKKETNKYIKRLEQSNEQVIRRVSN